MANKLSHSSSKMLSECGRKYELHYVQRFREYNSSAALVFGSAIDLAIGHLLLHRDVNTAIAVFNSAWTNAKIGSDVEPSSIPMSLRLMYSKSDFDRDLIEKQHLDSIRTMLSLSEDSDALYTNLYNAMNLKESKGINNLSKEQRLLINVFNWHCLKRKGILMVEAYASKVLPKIREVHSVQKEIALEDDKGNKITGFIDCIATWEDGKRYALDTKTSSIEYPRDSARISPQLILYYHAEKTAFSLDGVGFIVLGKRIIKNRVKMCNKCGQDGSNTSHKTCSSIVDGERCHGDFSISIKPEIYIQIILDSIHPRTEQLVMDNFSLLNKKIDAKIFEANLSACVAGWGKCPFYSKCHYGSNEGLIVAEERKDG